MTPIAIAALAEAIRNIREAAMRDVMVRVNRLQPTEAVEFSPDQETYRLAHRHCQLQVFSEIERMIAREASASDVVERDDDGDG